MPTTLIARAKIDDKLRATLAELRNGRHVKDVSLTLEAQGHYTTIDDFYNITNKDSARQQLTVPYEFYLWLVGEEPEKVYLEESPDLARRTAYWHCYLFGVGKYKFAEDVAADAKKHGLEYSINRTYKLLFTSRTKWIDPKITDSVMGLFNSAAGDGQFSSRDSIEEFLGYLDANSSGEMRSGNVEWQSVAPIVDTLILQEGISFYSLLGHPRKEFETGRRKVSARKYGELQRQLRELPIYPLLNELWRLLTLQISSQP